MTDIGDDGSEQPSEVSFELALAWDRFLVLAASVRRAGNVSDRNWTREGIQRFGLAPSGSDVDPR